MDPRFDVFRRQGEHFVKWVGTVESFENLEPLIRTDSELTNTPEDEYVVIHSAYGTTEAVKPLFVHRVVQIHS